MALINERLEAAGVEPARNGVLYVPHDVEVIYAEAPEIVVDAVSDYSNLLTPEQKDTLRKYLYIMEQGYHERLIQLPSKESYIKLTGRVATLHDIRVVLGLEPEWDDEEL